MDTNEHGFARRRATILPLLPSSLRFDAIINLNRAVAQRRRVEERAGVRTDVETNSFRA